MVINQNREVEIIADATQNHDATGCADLALDE
jgi:hypothetical protein